MAKKAYIGIGDKARKSQENLLWRSEQSKESKERIYRGRWESKVLF